MDAPNKSCPAHAAEVLSDYYQDNDAAVIGYNTKRTPKRGSAIFLHTHGKGSTAGCVSVTTAQAKTLLRWMDPEKTPRIVIAPRGELTDQQAVQSLIAPDTVPTSEQITEALDLLTER